MTIGPSDRRLEEPGDFVVEIDYHDLQPGPNQVRLTATDTIGTVRVETARFCRRPRARTDGA